MLKLSCLASHKGARARVTTDEVPAWFVNGARQKLGIFDEVVLCDLGVTACAQDGAAKSSFVVPPQTKVVKVNLHSLLANVEQKQVVAAILK